MKTQRRILPLLALLFIPAVAQANTGTPLMMATGLHLFVGNMLLGLGEGWLLAKVFRLPKKRCVWLMIAANYFSAWVGYVLLKYVVAESLHVDLYNAWHWMWVLVGAAYLLTLVLEFPFVAVSFKFAHGWFCKAVLGSLLIQTASYAVLIWLYSSGTGVMLYTQNEIVDIAEMALPQNIVVSFIADEDGDVYAGNIDEQNWQKIFDANSTNRWDCLMFIPSAADTNLCDLVAQIMENETTQLVTIREKIAFASSTVFADTNYILRVTHGSALQFGLVPKLAVAESGDHRFFVGYWPLEGIRDFGRKRGDSVLNLETPFFKWTIRNAVMIAPDKILFQFGDRQICVYDPEKKQVALLARGRGCVAMIEKNANRIGTP